MIPHRGTIKLNRLCLLFITLNFIMINVSGETDEDIVSIEETIEGIRVEDSPESTEININNEILNSADFYDIDSNSSSSSTESSPQTIGLIGEIKSNEEALINRTSGTNATTNENKVDCTLVNLTDSEVSGVKIVNSKRFMEFVLPKGNDSVCALALFYYPWCPFSAKASREFNAVGKIFPQLNVIALNAYLHNSINMRFGLVGVPTILFFHNGKIVAKYNSTESSLLSLVSFIHRLTGLEPDLSVNLTEDDWTNPLSTVPQPTIDYVLIIASIFLLFTICYLIARSTIFKKIIDSIRNTWREAEAQHQHVD